MRNKNHITKVSWDEIDQLAQNGIEIGNGENRTEIYSLVAFFEQEYAHWERKALDSEWLRKQYGTRAQDANDPTAYKKTVQMLMAELRNNHAEFCNAERRYHNVRVAEIEDDILVTRSEDDRFQVGDQVLEVDGIAVQDWIDSRAIYSKSSTPQYERLSWVEDIFRRFDFEEADREYLIQGISGQVHAVTCQIDQDREIGRTAYAEKVFFQEYSGIGYLAINSMRSGVVEEFLAVLPALNECVKLILDLRHNGGGSSSNGETMLPYLIDAPVEASVSRQLIQPIDPDRKREILLLISQVTHSAAESFVIDLCSTGSIKSIGTHTAGDTGCGPQPFKTDRNVLFIIPTRKENFLSPSGHAMEGVGYPPDEFIRQTRDDFLNGQDTVLEHALRRLSF